MNSKKSSVNKSGYSGVCFRKDSNNWRAYLCKDGKSYRKSFQTIEEAIEYRAELERIYFGTYSSNYKPTTLL